MEDSRPLWGYDVLRILDVLPDWMIFVCLLLIQNGWLIIDCLVLSLVLKISLNSFAEWFEQFSSHLGATQNYLSPPKN